MNSPDCRNDDQGIEDLSRTFEAGQSETLTGYLASVARCHKYSLQNVMGIVLQTSDSIHVAVFHTWHKLGRHVRRGERHRNICSDSKHFPLASGSSTPLQFGPRVAFPNAEKSHCCRTWTPPNMPPHERTKSSIVSHAAWPRQRRCTRPKQKPPMWCARPSDSERNRRRRLHPVAPR